MTEIFARFGKTFGQYGEIFARFCEKNGQYGSTFTHFGEKLGDMVLFHFGHEAQMTRAVTVDDRRALAETVSDLYVFANFVPCLHIYKELV